MMSIRSRAIREWTFTVMSAFSALLGSTAFAQPAFQLELLTPTELRVAPGQSVEHGLRIRNVGDAPGPLLLSGRLNIENRLSESPYQFGAASNPRCGTMPATIGLQIDLTTDSLAAGEVLDCRWIVHRPLQAMFDIYLDWNERSMPLTNAARVFFGTLTDSAISTRTRSFHVGAYGIGRSTIELSVRNQGSAALSGLSAGGCYDGDVDEVFVEDSMGPGGCGEARWGPICFGTGFGFAFPEIQAGQEYSCTFNVRTRDVYTAPVGRGISLPTEQQSADGYMLLDTHPENNDSTITVGVDGYLGTPVTLDALDRIATLLLIAMTTLIAALSLARRRRARTGIQLND